MAGQKSKRKRRNASAAPRAVKSTRREERVQKAAATPRPPTRLPGQPAGTVGERPPSPFGGLPVAEIAIFVGLIGVIAGFIAGGVSLIVGVVVMALGVIEVTAREHFSGYRSHATLLAAFPAVATEILLVVIFDPKSRALPLLPALGVFGLAFWWLRGRFRIARQRRLARPPRPTASQ